MTNPAAQPNGAHPIFEQACGTFSGNVERAANQPGPMRAFVVRFMRGGIVEAQFEAMAEDSVACTIEHMGRANGAAVKVMALPEWNARCEREAQDRARDELTESDLESIDSAMHADKKANGYDARRIAAAAKVEMSQRRAQGDTW